MSRNINIATVIVTVFFSISIIFIIIGSLNLKSGCEKYETKCQINIGVRDSCHIREINSNITCISYDNEWVAKCKNGKIEKCYKRDSPFNDYNSTCLSPSCKNIGFIIMIVIGCLFFIIAILVIPYLVYSIKVKYSNGQEKN